MTSCGFLYERAVQLTSTTSTSRRPLFAARHAARISSLIAGVEPNDEDGRLGGSMARSSTHTGECGHAL
jgi:hypothetical protein